MPRCGIRPCATWRPFAKNWGVPTIFNILGPLANPAGASFQLLGVGREDLQTLLAQALAMLGTQRAVVVFGADGLDEVTLADATYVTEVTPRQVRRLVWDPVDFDLDPISLETLVVQKLARERGNRTQGIGRRTRAGT